MFAEKVYTICQQHEPLVNIVPICQEESEINVTPIMVYSCYILYVFHHYYSRDSWCMMPQTRSESTTSKKP